MTAPHDPNVRAMVDDVERLASMVIAEERRMREVSYSFADDTGTVTVQVNGYLWLTGIDIADGTLRLGVHVVQARIDEALSRATEGVPAYLDAHLAQVEAHLTDVLHELAGANRQSDQMRADSRDAVGDINS